MSVGSPKRCPLCGSLNARIIKLTDVELIVTMWRERLQIDVRSEFRGISQVELWQCLRCLLNFFAPECLAGSAWLYAQLDGFDWYYRPGKWEHEIAIGDLQGCKRVLEVGSGFGSFIILGRKQLGLEIEGLEQNPRAIEESARQGLRVREAMVEDVAQKVPGIYDAICSFQVLEHVPRPKAFLDACCTLLHPGGRLLLGVPNAKSYIRYLNTQFDLPPHHMTRWTVHSLTRVQDYFPLKLARVAYEPLPEYEVEWYVEAYEGILRRRGLGFLMHPWIRSRTIGLIKGSRIRRVLKGETIYANYVRT